jgi:hypothetical protein
MNYFKNTMLVLVSICLLGAPAFSAEQSKTFLFGKIESNLWEATASVFLHLADDDQKATRTSLTDYNDDMDTIDRVVAKLEKMNLSGSEKAALNKIKADWQTHKVLGETLISSGYSKEKKDALTDAELHEYWKQTEDIDHDIDTVLHALEGQH